MMQRFMDIVRYYTREAGVRGLERQIAGICRKAAKQIVTGEKKSVTVSPKTLESLIGKKKVQIWPSGNGQSNRCCDRTCIYTSWWRYIAN